MLKKLAKQDDEDSVRIEASVATARKATSVSELVRLGGQLPDFPIRALQKS